MLRIGSLCSGYGGLDLAVEEVTAARTVWHSEIGPSARILAEHWPGVPNLGDLTQIDWFAVEPIEIITAGYPCQPFSHAGARRGTNDDRHLWPHIADAIRVLRPRFVVLENVDGHRSLGLDVVLGDLAALGYDARWACVRASEAGATHERKRIFILAWCGQAVPDAACERRDEGSGLRADKPAEIGRLFAGDSSRDSGFQWLDYAAAIETWETVVGRPAPVPVVKGPGGGIVPSARFIEWMQGLPDGWVTDVQGITIEEQIEALGNGVVPQQGVLALRSLFDWSAVAA